MTDDGWRWESAWFDRWGEPHWRAHATYEAAMEHGRALVAQHCTGVVVQHVHPETETIRERVEM